jgi:hypothetical protein
MLVHLPSAKTADAASQDARAATTKIEKMRTITVAPCDPIFEF